jgi:hypothetical protein
MTRVPFSRLVTNRAIALNFNPIPSLKRYRCCIVLLIICLIMFPLSCRSWSGESQLDKPAFPEKATVRSEIYRANRAMLACSIDQPSLSRRINKPEAVEDLLAHTNCMQRIIGEAARSGTYSRAFELGLYFEFVTELGMMNEVYESSKSKLHPLYARSFRDSGKALFDHVTEQAKEIGVTIEEISAAAGYRGRNYELALKLFRTWDASPK